MRTLILLSVVAFAIATPIDDKTVARPAAAVSTPDISKLPLEKDTKKVDFVKVEPHPLHKRDTQKIADPSTAPVPSSGIKTQPAPSNVPQSNVNSGIKTPSALSSNVNTQQTLNQQRQPSNNNQQRQPLNNQQRKPVTNSNNQQPLLNNQRQPASSLNGQNSNNAQKAQTQVNPSAPRPLTQSSGPVTLSQSARVKRDAPVVDQKNNNQKQGQTLTVPKANTEQKAPKAQAQGSRVTRENPKTTDVKATQSAPSTLNRKPVAATAPVVPAKTQPAQGSRVTREAPKVTDTKAPQPITSTLNRKPVAATAPVVPAKTQPAQGSRVTREAPKATVTKVSQPVASTLNQKPVAATAPVVPAKTQPAQGSRVTREAPKTDVKASQPAPSSLNQKPVVKPVATNSRTPVASTNSRPVREAPNPYEQSKIVPGANYKPTDSNNQAQPSKSSVKVAADPIKPIKRESPTSNIRESAQPSYDNTSPNFVHPVPVDQILKKPSIAQPTATVTKTDDVKIEPALPITEVKPVTSNDQKSPVKYQH